MNQVIAITGPIGAGKTSLVQGLAAALKDATALDCDRYQRVTEASTPTIQSWLAGGADANAFIIPQLPDDLAKLKRGESVADPLTGTTIAPGKYILLETNFGREHTATARHIDLVLWIDTPLDIALARKAKEHITGFLSRAKRADYGESLRWLHQWLDNYLDMTRALMHIQKERIGANADIIIDGQRPADLMVRDAMATILGLANGAT